MVLDYTKVENEKYIHYTFKSLDDTVRVVFYNIGGIEDIIDDVPNIIYGKLGSEKIDKFPLFGIKYETLVVNNDDMYDTIADISVDFLENYNNSIKYFFIKVDATDSVDDKKDELHTRMQTLLPEIVIDEIGTNDNGDIIYKMTI